MLAAATSEFVALLCSFRSSHIHCYAFRALTLVCGFDTRVSFFYSREPDRGKMSLTLTRCNDTPVGLLALLIGEAGLTFPITL